MDSNADAAAHWLMNQASAIHPDTRTDADLASSNRHFYDALWNDARLIEPQRFNTWPLVQELAGRTTRRLEIAPGLRPRLPLDGTQFLDICAFDIVEHVVDDEGVLAELSRVTESGGYLLLSVPLDPAAWNAFDDFVGHYRRYEPDAIAAKLAVGGFVIERSAAYGMQPKSSRLLDIGQWYLTHKRERAMWWYNRVFMPLGLRFQRPLAIGDGLIDTTGIDEILLVCRKTAA
jgi:SAM-dependent methyltransferase